MKARRKACEAYGVLGSEPRLKWVLWHGLQRPLHWGIHTPGIGLNFIASKRSVMYEMMERSHEMSREEHAEERVDRVYRLLPRDLGTRASALSRRMRRALTPR